MTCKEAHKFLEIKQREMTIKRHLYNKQAIEITGLAIEALEKQMPKRVIRPYKGNYKCPTCENYIYITDDDLYVYGIEPPKYCDECGQALDWSNN